MLRICSGVVAFALDGGVCWLQTAGGFLGHGPYHKWILLDGGDCHRRKSGLARDA